MAKKDFNNVNTAPVFDVIAAATQDTTQTPEKRRPGRPGRTDNTERFSLAVAPDLAEYIRTMARITGRSMNDFIILALEQHKENNATLYAEAQKFINSLEK